MCADVVTYLKVSTVIKLYRPAKKQIEHIYFYNCINLSYAIQARRLLIGIMQAQPSHLHELLKGDYV